METKSPRQSRDPATMTTPEWFTFEAECRAAHGRYFCRRCADKALIVPADERFSMGCYAGMLCDACWAADGRNHDRDFDPADAGESLDPEETADPNDFYDWTNGDDY